MRGEAERETFGAEEREGENPLRDDLAHTKSVHITKRVRLLSLSFKRRPPEE